MIAVFTRSQIRFKAFKFRPNNFFIRIKNIDDIRGRKFIGVISERGWNNGNIEMADAYNHLTERQPELFVN